MKEITITLVVACALSGAGCSPSEEAPKGPASPTATIAPPSQTPALSESRLKAVDQEKDVATAIIPAETTDKVSADPSP